MTCVSVIPVIRPKLRHFWWGLTLLLWFFSDSLGCICCTWQELACPAGGSVSVPPSVAATTTTRSTFKGWSLPAASRKSDHSCTWRCVCVAAMFLFLLRFCSCFHYSLCSCGFVNFGCALAWCVCVCVWECSVCGLWLLKLWNVKLSWNNARC